MKRQRPTKLHHSPPYHPEVAQSHHRDEIGGILGVAGSLEASTRVIAPSAGGLLLQNLGVWAPGVFSALAASKHRIR